MKENNINKNDSQNKDNDQELANRKAVNHFKTKEGKATFNKRLVSSIVMLVILVFYLAAGGIYSYMNYLKNIDIASYFSILISLVICGAAIFEMNKATGFNKIYQQIPLILISLVLYLYPISTTLYNFSFYKNLNLNEWLNSWHILVLFLLTFFIYAILGYFKKGITMTNIMMNYIVMIIIVVAFKTFSITSMDLLKSGNKPIFSFNTIVWIWLMIIFGDSFAYIGGMLFGKTKLAPKISPSKSWEGAGIGLSAAFLIGLVYVFIFYFVDPLNNFKPLNVGIDWVASEWLRIVLYLLLAIIFPLIGMFGDLLFSWIKRSVNIKDYSNLIPGHGGVLDRLDSIIVSLFVLFPIILIIPVK
ncbi:phosphatidate cytidylyltransferase [Spiroplasma helicoides]|uniref:Phosphatidate cytidylyltransferase n=1 Tax=Spiroplasma helicoides TaxID=216938 RepID=A0A1B3SL22_9MOLU|nr:phosphatidate cytidylyltransferase [Spiroplasma helicoides]AOG60634.1 phosphatidate cytidylyltransferase [Spiroplasma helicoides]